MFCIKSKKIFSLFLQQEFDLRFSNFLRKNNVRKKLWKLKELNTNIKKIEFQHGQDER